MAPIPSRFRPLRYACYALGGVLLIAALAVGGLYLYLRTGLPQIADRLSLPGLGQPVDVSRDADGIPTIRAATEPDAYFALGFTHAQDRLWQMELMRRSGAGRLAEIVGPRALRLDRFARTLGLYGLAEQSLAALSPPVRAALESYASGVNAFLSSHRGAWPPEFELLRIVPEPWRPADSLVWQRQMALVLQGNWHEEATRVRLADRLTPGQIDDLFPPQDNAPLTLRRAAAEAPDSRFFAALLAVSPDAFAPRLASNAWAVAGRHTASGKPVLANDPHLGFRAPGQWYLVRIELPGLTLSGGTIPGVPFHILGHNGRIAWGMTTTGSDAQDLFLERLDPAHPAQYLTPDGPRPFNTRTESLRVRGEPDEILTIRTTRHGPVISDLIDEIPGTGQAMVVALAATALWPDDRTAEAIYSINRARDWNDFMAAARLFHAPQQNLMYADVDGNIGLVAPGRIPLRPRGNGLVPADGRTGENDWRGLIPFDSLPRAFNPAAGRIANANNAIVDGGYPYYLGEGWAPGFRARRIETLLDAQPALDVARSAAMQLDRQSLMAAELAPLMLRAMAGAQPADPRAGAAMRLLGQWDGAMPRDRPEPLIFTAWLRSFVRLVFADELGPAFASWWDLQPLSVARVLQRSAAWCDDIATPLSETCPDRLAAALDDALGALADAHGEAIDNWRWGDDHYAHFRHPLFGFLPVLRDLADLSIAVDGDGYTLNRAASPVGDLRRPFRAVHGAGMRAIYDLSDLDASRFIQATGPSGNPLSAFYGNLLRRWRDGVYLTLDGRQAVATLRLEPKEMR